MLKGHQEIWQDTYNFLGVNDKKEITGKKFWGNCGLPLLKLWIR